MGFSLSIVKIEDSEPELEQEIRQLIAGRGELNETIDTQALPSEFPFECYEGDDEEGPAIYHVEVGWSWWDCLAEAMEETLGTEGSKTCRFMKAWRGFALPFDLEPTILADRPHEVDPPITVTTSPPTSLLGKIANIFKPKSAGLPAGTQDLIGSLIDERSGGSNGCRIASATRILAEIEAVCRAWGFPEDEAEGRAKAFELYEEMPEDAEPVARCYALISRTFFRFAVKHHHAVCFAK